MSSLRDARVMKRAGNAMLGDRVKEILQIGPRKVTVRAVHMKGTKVASPPEMKKHFIYKKGVLNALLQFITDFIPALRGHEDRLAALVLE